MVQQTDSINGEFATLEEEGLQEAATHRGQLTPRVVLSWLPKDATPAQQDSMVRAHIKPSEIHWSNMPDTLHLPGHAPGRSLRDVSLPQYYRESFFSKDSLFHPELPGGRQGVAGDPVPYTVAGDNLVTSLLLLCFFLACVAFSQSRHFVVRQAKTFFRPLRVGTTVVSETSSELRFQLLLVLKTCLLVSIGYFFYSRASISDTFAVEQYQVITIYACIVAGYFLMKTLLYCMTGLIFFDRKKNEQWLKAYLFLTSTEGILFFPVVMLMAYFDLSLQIAVIYALVILGLVKILSFYKTYLIFFRGKGAFLQIILYFCALEMIPLLALWGGLVLMSHYLKINF